MLSLMCYAFMCSDSKNYNRNRKCRKCLHNLSHGCRCASWLTFWQLYYFSTFYFLACWLVAMADMAVLKAIVSLYRAGEEKPIERYKSRVKVAEENKLVSSFQKSIIEFLGLNEQAQKFGLGSFHLKFYHLTKINCKAETNKQTNKQTNTYN